MTGTKQTQEFRDFTGSQEVRNECLGIDIVSAVANVEGIDPMDLEPTLYSVVDPEALEQLYKDGSGPHVAFDYAGHEVIIQPDRTITVDGRRPLEPTVFSRQ